MRLFGGAVLVLITLLGVWLASSLVAYAGGPPWLALVGGVVLFPVLPLWWEHRATEAFYAEIKRATRLLPKKRALTGFTRVALRTVFINVVFIAALVALWPRVVFAALVTRGDWFLGDSQGTGAAVTRKVLLATASGLEWVHEAANENPYRTKEDEQQPVPDTVKPVVASVTTPHGSGARWRRLSDGDGRGGGGDGLGGDGPDGNGRDGRGGDGRDGNGGDGRDGDGRDGDGHDGDGRDGDGRDGDGRDGRGGDGRDGDGRDGDGRDGNGHDGKLRDGDGDGRGGDGRDGNGRGGSGPAHDPGARWIVGDTSWPRPAVVHPVVQGMTSSDETSPEAVARYLRARIDDPFERVKALHDWLVTRLRYDEAALKGPRPPQDAQSVFLARRGVCEGYARLFVELGRHSGDRVVYLTGEVREESGALAPVGHAWNAVEVKGAWYLVDATWDDPVMSDGSDTYRTDYLFIPPDLAVMNHFPDEPRWQLKSQPLGRAQFLRQPPATIGLEREGLRLVSPVRATDQGLVLTLENPAGVFVMVALQPEGTKCGAPSDERQLVVSCPVSASSKKAVVFVNDTREGQYGSVASFAVAP